MGLGLDNFIVWFGLDWDFGLGLSIKRKSRTFKDNIWNKAQRGIKVDDVFFPILVMETILAILNTRNKRL